MDYSQSNLWQSTCREQFSADALHGSVDVDLVVIGGGYSGLSAALYAAENGLSVAVLEAFEIGHGGSGRNVGLCNAGLWLPPEEINKRLGETHGGRLSRILGEAPDTVFGLIDRFQIDCEPVRGGTLHCAHSKNGFQDLQKRARQLQAINAPVQLIEVSEAKARVGSDRVFGALFDPRAGTIQPLAYAKGLARAAVQCGAQIYENSPALSVGWDDNRWDVATPSGMVTSKALIQATNAYSAQQSWVAAPRMIPVHYFQAATEPLSAEVRATILEGGEGCWDTATVMSSWRLDQEGRMIIGAMGQLDHGGSRVHANWLVRKMRKMFPALKGETLTHLWHGRIGMTKEYLPKIQRIGPNALSCFGYSGRGIGPGTVFGQSMVEALLKGDEEFLPTVPVNSHTLPFSKSKALFYETGATLTHALKDRF